MIQTDIVTTRGKQFQRTWSDSGCLIERDGALYAEAIDPLGSGRTYTKADALIEVEHMTETDEKGAAYDILMQAAGKVYAAGYKVQHNGKLWKYNEPGHTSQTGWEPSVNTASLWTEICETHDGTQYDPIPYDGNMALESGKYYTQDGVTYVCTRDSGNPVYHALKDLIGLYVEITTE